MFRRASIIALIVWLNASVAFGQTITNTTPNASDLGVVTRNIPSGTQAVSGPVTDAQLRATAVPVDGSGVTQPVSAASLPLPTGASTAAKQPALGTAGTASSDVITVQGIASMTALKTDGSAVTQPVSGTVTANAGTGTFTNQQSNKTADFDTGAGTDTVTMFGVALPKSGGAVAGGTSTDPIRTDPTGTTTQPVSGTVTVTQSTASNLKVDLSGTAANTTAIKVDGSAVTQPVSGTVTANATLAAETTKVIGTARVLGNAGAAIDAATGAAPPANAVLMGGLKSGATGGFVSAIPVCDSFVNVNVSTATTTLLVTGVSGRHVRICSLSLVTAAANNVALISGTGATCGTGTSGMNGGTTAATGWNFAANGGITQGSGIGSINQTNATGDSVCVVTSAATQLSGRISYTIY